MKKFFILPFLFLYFKPAYSMDRKDEKGINTYDKIEAYKQLLVEAKLEMVQNKIKFLQMQLNINDVSNIEYNIAIIQSKMKNTGIQFNLINEIHEILGIITFIYYKSQEKMNEISNTPDPYILQLTSFALKALKPEINNHKSEIMNFISEKLDLLKNGSSEETKAQIKDIKSKINNIELDQISDIIDSIDSIFQEEINTRKNAKNSNLLESIHSLSQELKGAISNQIINDENIGSYRPCIINFMRLALEKI